MMKVLPVAAETASAICVMSASLKLVVMRCAGCCGAAAAGGAAAGCAAENAAHSDASKPTANRERVNVIFGQTPASQPVDAEAAVSLTTGLRLGFRRDHRLRERLRRARRQLRR